MLNNFKAAPRGLKVYHGIYIMMICQYYLAICFMWDVKLPAIINTMVIYPVMYLDYGKIYLSFILKALKKQCTQGI